jgi:DNA-binding CsgD family transcriptional regulator
MAHVAQTDELVINRSGRPYHAGREPSFTAMWHACLRNMHAISHVSPVFVDTRSVQLVPLDVRQRVRSLMDTFSPETADAVIFMSVIRHRVLAERLSAAYERGFRQFVVLGAGLDTTAFVLAEQGNDWRVFEVDHPATQDWKRTQLANLGWETPANLVYAPCDFETQDLLSALDLVGFERTQPAVLSMCEEACAVREQFGHVGADEDESGLHALCGLLEVSIRCGDTTTAEALLRRLSSLAGRLQPYYTIVSFGRLLGEAAAMLRRPGEARSYFRQALELCQRVRFRPEIALLHLDLAQLLSDSYPRERAEAVEHLRFAISEFAEMHMQPSLDRANRLLARLTSVDSTPAVLGHGLIEALTAREREVAGLVGSGRSNRDIASTLVITEATVEVHVKHILGKLGFRSRSQVAVWAVEHNLTERN